jgi:hypothetical protein
VSTACSSDTWVPQKHGARQSHGCLKPSFSEHGYPHASPPVTEPAYGTPRAIRVPPTNSVRSAQPRTIQQKNHQANRQTDHHANRPTSRLSNKRTSTREAVLVRRQSCLPESTGGEACARKDSREGGVQTPFALASTVLFGYHIGRLCTLWTLTSPRFESVFFASFLCRFGQRNDVPPRTVANSDKENIQLTQAANPESSNPALTPTANPGTWQPGINSDR